jgi:hypothetical protein
MKDIFDLTDTSDLPEDIRPKRPGPKRGNSRASRIRELLAEAGRPVGALQISAAYFRKYGSVINRSTMAGSLHDLEHWGHVVKTGRGTYALPEHANVTPIKRA